MPVVDLTTDYIENLIASSAKDIRGEHCDQQVRGMYIRQGTYYLRFKWLKKTAHAPIGKIDEVSLEDARKAALDYKAMVKKGIDPRKQEANGNSLLTLRGYMEQHYIPFAKNRKKTWKDDADLCRRRLYSRFGDCPLNQIKRRDIEQFHNGLRDEGLSGASADHYVRLLKRALKLAVEWELLEKNPAENVKLFLEPNAVEHYLTEEQLAQLMKVLLKYRDTNVSLLARLLLATGARLSECMLALWSWVDKERRVLVVPAGNSKSKKQRVIPLSDAALQVLDELGTEGKSKYLFVNKTTGKQLKYAGKVWIRLRNEAGLPWLRIHDLRHSAASFMISSGRTLFEVQQVLGHSTPVMTQRYAHLAPQALLDSANATSAIIEQAMAANGE